MCMLSLGALVPTTFTSHVQENVLELVQTSDLIKCSSVKH